MCNFTETKCKLHVRDLGDDLVVLGSATDKQQPHLLMCLHYSVESLEFSGIASVSAIATSPDGEKVWVASCTDCSIKAFDSRGQILRCLPYNAKSPISQPFGLALDSSGQVFVSSFDKGRIVVLRERDLSVLRTFAQKCSDMHLFQPLALAVSGNLVYVCVRNVKAFDRVSWIIVRISGG